MVFWCYGVMAVWHYGGVAIMPKRHNTETPIIFKQLCTLFLLLCRNSDILDTN